MRMSSYSANHKRVKRVRGLASTHTCEICGEVPALDWSTIHGRSGDDPSDFRPLCRKCHDHYDGHGHLGRKASDETRQKMSEHAKARCTPEWRAAKAENLRQKWAEGAYDSKRGPRNARA